MSPIGAVITALLPDSGPGKLKLKEVVEKILELKQEELKGTLKGLSWEELREITSALTQVVRFKPKGRGLSQAARVFAMVRAIQSGSVIEKPQAWLDNVARAAERELWTKDASAGSRPISVFPSRTRR